MDKKNSDVTSAERVAKAIARAGLCSRREAERWIEAGRVSVNGEILDSPAVTVTPDDQVVVDGRPLPSKEPPRLWRYHKARGTVTSEKDPDGRPTVFDELPPGLPRLLNIGRLDIASEGLLLMTNDGALKRKLELPSTGWVRRYRVRVHGAVSDRILEPLRKGVTIEGQRYLPAEVVLERAGSSNSWLMMGLREGKNREIRRLCEHVGLQVSRLIRVSYGPFQLGAMKPGELQEVPSKVLAEQLGKAVDSPQNKTQGEGFAKARPRKNTRKGPHRPPRGKKT